MQKASIDFIGIYLANNENCYPNRTYFWDSSVNSVTEAISCVLPGTSLTTGQWVRVADPDDPVDCNSNNASDPFRCTSVTSPATLSLYLVQELSTDQEGWYKCCLPTDCSDPNANIIFANIFSKRRLLSLTDAYVASERGLMSLSDNWLSWLSVFGPLKSFAVLFCVFQKMQYKIGGDLEQKPWTIVFAFFQKMPLFKIDNNLKIVCQNQLKLST